MRIPRRALVTAAVFACALAPLRAQTARQDAAPPALEERADEAESATTAVTTRILSRITVPFEASGRYAFERERESIEADFGAEGLSGYITVMNDASPHKGEPLTFFFAATEIGGSHIHFVTHQIHRTRYEFDGDVIEFPPTQPRNLQPQFDLRGTLTIHRLGEDGREQQESRSVVFHKFVYGR